MNFVAPQAIWAILVIVPGVIWFLWWSWRVRKRLMRLFVSERLLPQLLEGFSPTRQKIKMTLLTLAILFLMVALARPQWGVVWEEANQRGRDILIAIDTSRSMLAEDMAPNRLARAKLAALDLMRLSKTDRFGLIAFAGGAFLQCPLTLDEEAFRQNVNSLDTTIIPQGGTALTEAMDTAQRTFSAEEGANHKVLIIFTDGEDHESGALEAADKAVEKGLKIYTVGVGTPAGELLKVSDDRGASSFVKDESGNVVKSRLNEDLLRQIATKGNGFYVALREGGAMQALYQRGLEPMPTSEISSKLVRHLNEQFHWPLGIAIALLLTEILLPSAPKKAGAISPSRKPKRAMAGVAILLLLVCGRAQASPGGAYQKYKAGHFKDARNEYERLLEKKPDDPKLNYNAGAASFRSGAYDAAIKQFSNALKAEDLKLQEAAYYNLGNSNFKLGDEAEDPKTKIALWSQAIQNFESSLKLNPQDADAQFNRDLVQKKLEELKKQQPEQNKDQENKDDQKKDDEKKDEQKKDQENKDQKQQDPQNEKDQDKKDSKSDQEKKDEEQKKQQEQQKQDQKDQDAEKQQQQQDQASKDKDKDGQEKKDSKQAGDQGEKKPDDKSDPKAEAEQEARAAQLGQMTQKQAQQMLDAQKSDEKALIYRQSMERKPTRNKGAFKDW